MAIGRLHSAHRRASPDAASEATGHAGATFRRSFASCSSPSATPRASSPIADSVRRALRSGDLHRSRNRALRLDRHRALRPRRTTRRRHAERRRNRDAPRQAHRRRPHRSVPAGDALAHVDRLSLEADLRRALERGEIKVLFQPIVRLEDRTVAGFEAWRGGIIRAWVGSRRANSFPSPRRRD